MIRLHVTDELSAGARLTLPPEQAAQHAIDGR